MPELAAFLDSIDALIARGRRALATVRPAELPGASDASGVTDPIGAMGVVSAPGVAVDDWSSQRTIVYDQAMANRWKTDCLRLLREAFGAASAPYRDFGTTVERAGVLWRAIAPGLDLLERVRASVTPGASR